MARSRDPFGTETFTSGAETFPFRTPMAAFRTGHDPLPDGVLPPSRRVRTPSERGANLSRTGSNPLGTETLPFRTGVDPLPDAKRPVPNVKVDEIFEDKQVSTLWRQVGNEKIPVTNLIRAVPSAVHGDRFPPLRSSFSPPLLAHAPGHIAHRSKPCPPFTFAPSHLLPSHLLPQKYALRPHAPR